MVFSRSGIFELVSLAVNRRTREMSIRVAAAGHRPAQIPPLSRETIDLIGNLGQLLVYWLSS